MKTFYAISKDRETYISITAHNRADAYFCYSAHKLDADFTALFETTRQGDFPYEIFPERYGRHNFGVANKNGKLIFLDDKREEVIEFVCEKVIPGDTDFYWIYEFSGLHDGEPIKVAVKNPRPDWSTYGGFAPDHYGLFWEDDLTPLDDIFDEWYHDKWYDAFCHDFND